MVDAGLEVCEGDRVHLELKFRGYFRPEVCEGLYVGRGGTIGGVGKLGRCPRERPGPEPKTARRDRASTGDVGAESRLAGAAEEPCAAGAEAVRRTAALEVLVVDPESDIVGGTRGCTTGEGNSQGGGECRTR